jgi:hypothetical protein
VDAIIWPAANWKPQILSDAEVHHQKRGLFQVDIGKVVLGYSARKPQGGDAYLAHAFQGAADSRANSPHQSELDLEAKTRISWTRITSFSLGEQSDLEYDRSAQGNLQSNPVNAGYSLNSFTVGGFFQKDLPFPPQRRKRELAEKDLSTGKLKFVLATFQYQHPVVGSYLFFPDSPPSKQESTLHLPAAAGFARRAGLRWEAESTRKWFASDKGPYIEVGPQFTVQNNILASVTLTTAGNAPHTCQASSKVTIGNCFKAAQYPVDSTTTATDTVETLHAYGFYWDVHFQKALTQLADKSGPGISLFVETKGDAFLRRGVGKALSTQTLYDAPLSVSFGLPCSQKPEPCADVFAIFYRSQVTGQHLWVNSFGINARWYIDRDAAVRGSHQVTFKGPASADETKSAKSK